MRKAAMIAAFFIRCPTSDYSERQLAFVVARMPMKAGTKMVEANTVITSARYISFSCGARGRTSPGLRRSTTAWLIGMVFSAGGVEILTQPSRSLAYFRCCFGPGPMRGLGLEGALRSLCTVPSTDTISDWFLWIQLLSLMVFVIRTSYSFY